MRDFRRSQLFIELGPFTSTGPSGFSWFGSSGKLARHVRQSLSFPDTELLRSIVVFASLISSCNRIAVETHTLFAQSIGGVYLHVHQRALLSLVSLQRLTVRLTKRTASLSQTTNKPTPLHHG